VLDLCQARELNVTASGLRSRSLALERELSNQELRVVQPFRRPFSPYDWLKKVATEYYFRYEGSLTVPPCFAQSVHWRVMKNSIRVSPEQIRLLEDLIANRINPSTCSRETAAAPRSGTDRVNVNRPLQYLSSGHRAVFCECIDWESTMPADIAWCKLSMPERGVAPYWKLLPTK
jgi:Eukaryotic-type carbonic anhydrase